MTPWRSTAPRKEQRRLNGAPVNALPLSNTERSRRFRERQRRGAQYFAGYLPHPGVNLLIDCGYIDEDASDDPRAVGEALIRMFHKLTQS